VRSSDIADRSIVEDGGKVKGGTAMDKDEKEGWTVDVRSARGRQSSMRQRRREKGYIDARVVRRHR
jgi:hypothetical protein